MTRKERLEAVFRGEPVDRVPVKLWNVWPGQEMLHPAYEPVYRLGVGRTDLMVGEGSPFDLFCGAHRDRVFHRQEIPTDSPEWVKVVTTIDTPEGELRGVYRKSTCKKPGYEMEYPVKEPDDIKRLLSLPYDPFPFTAEPFRKREEEIGDAGIVVFGLDHAMYGLQRMIGSENFALWSIHHRTLIVEAIDIYVGRLLAHVNLAFDAGLRPAFGWVGPELCIPPLMSPADFGEFVVDVDKKLCDLIHERGGFVWVHCHGKMGPVIDGFLEMGTDVLNPIEPPPMGDMTLEEAFGVVGDRMGLEGNIETHDIMTAPKDALAATIGEAVATGSRRGRRFILCASSGYMEDPEPSETLIENLICYIEEGIRYAEQCAP